MKNWHFKNNNSQIKNEKKTLFENQIIKTTDINVLLNRVRIEKKVEFKKKIFLSFYIITILSFLTITVLVGI